MKFRILLTLLSICAASESRADIVQVIANGNFYSDNSNLHSWEVTTSDPAAGNWVWATEPPTLLVLNTGANDGVGYLLTDIDEPFTPGTMSLHTGIGPITPTPALTTSGTLSWTHYLDSAIADWGPGQQFRVLLRATQSGNEQVAFTKNSGDLVQAPQTLSVNVLGFLQSLAVGESFSLIFEATAMSPMHLEVDSVSLIVDAPAAVPEPGSFLLCTLVGGAVVARRRRKKPLAS
ncbi:hypothetical protein Pan44_47080 [Caulifigura coniformis]|uniref:PEP-CTERM protein-sorting domain-containing protein n=1 Tax=Caulifigura coniformis TaxID=2527983 RepID=A0A517SKK5_9PLAN|nr:PEP-CTERM sorting domain-containing protein [Caulifigura coniformis]QDT56651.1 hypothetical protein Pan44_47080 [Caulifigura coniformis]